jgi:cbb3-type cytochrome oxidase cytochrome c subunit
VEVAAGDEAARAQAAELAAALSQETSISELEDKKVTALIAYLLRLGTDTMPKEAAQ